MALRIKPADRQFLQGNRGKHLLAVAAGKVKNLGFMARNPVETFKLRRKIGPYVQRARNLREIRYLAESLLKKKRLVPLQVLSRVKTSKSLWEKIHVQKRPLQNSLNEAIGLRLIFRDKRECWMAAEILKSFFTANNLGKLTSKDDYIKKPRAYGYKSIHQRYVWNGIPFEIHIRSIGMEKDILLIDKTLGNFANARAKAARKKYDDIFKEIESSFASAIKARRKKPAVKIGRNTYLRFGESSQILAKELENHNLPFPVRNLLLQVLFRRGFFNEITKGRLQNVFANEHPVFNGKIPAKK